MTFLEETILFTLWFLVMFGGYIISMKLQDAFMGYKSDTLGSLDAKDKLSLYVKKNQLWVIPLAALFIGLVAATIINV